MRTLVGQQHWNSETYKEDGKVKMEIHGGWVNYMNESLDFVPINCLPLKTPEGFVVTQAPFNFIAPLYADGEAFFESDVRYDIFRKERINDDPFGVYMKAKQASHVPGKLFDINGDGRKDAVIYENAFPKWNADLIYYIKHGRAPRLEKLVRFNSAPENVGSEISVKFDMRYSSAMTIKPRLSNPSNVVESRVKKHLAKERRELKKKSKESFKKAMSARLDAMEARRTVWNGEGLLRTKESIAHRPNGAVSSSRGS
jgi:hypothetical protein